MPFLTCRRCGVVLTKRVQLAPESARVAGPEMGEAAVPPTQMIELASADVVPVYRADRVVGQKEYSPSGALALNPQDVWLNQWESIPEHDNGCCGSDGMDGPNRRCLCGNILGTQWSDCWTVAEARFLPDAVKIHGD